MELRWLERETGITLQDENAYYYPQTERILQYRIKYTKTHYDSIDNNRSQYTNTLMWSEWQDVPVVYESNVMEKTQ